MKMTKSFIPIVQCFHCNQTRGYLEMNDDGWCNHCKYIESRRLNEVANRWEKLLDYSYCQKKEESSPRPKKVTS